MAKRGHVTLAHKSLPAYPLLQAESKVARWPTYIRGLTDTVDVCCFMRQAVSGFSAVVRSSANRVANGGDVRKLCQKTRKPAKLGLTVAAVRRDGARIVNSDRLNEVGAGMAFPWPLLKIENCKLQYAGQACLLLFAFAVTMDWAMMLQS